LSSDHSPWGLPKLPRRRLTITSLLCAAAAFLSLTVPLLSACSKSPEGRSSGILLRGIGPEPDSLDPQKAASVEAQTILRDVCEGLTTLDKSAGVIPGAARTFDISSDGRTYTFHLRPDARWSTGDRVVGADFVAALRRLADPATASTYAHYVSAIAHAPGIFDGKEPPESLGVAAPDDATVVIELAAPASYFPQLLAHPSTCPVHRPTLARYGTSFARGGHMVSDGAFVLEEWQPGSHILLTPNRHYWNHSATHLNAVKYLFIENANDELTRYRAGGLHVTAGVSRAQFDWVRSTLGDQLHLSPQLGTYFYGFNLNRSPFQNNPKLRRALSLAIDRERLTHDVLRAGETPAYSWIPPGVNGYSSPSLDSRGAAMSERLAEARRLYAESGYSAANPLHFELRYNNGEIHSKLAIAIAAMWKETLGVEVTLTAEEFKSLLQDIERGELQMFRSSWLADYNDAYGFAQIFESSSGVNMTHYSDSAYDALLVQARSEANPTKRQQLLQRAEAMVLEAQPVIPIYFYVNKHLVKPEVRGWYDNAMNIVYSKDLWLAPLAAGSPSP
jgi:oligopeptide transport system substrate-binding protein